MRSTINTIKKILIILFSILVILDVWLVFYEDLPTFSYVVKKNRTNLIWLTFLFGGLVSKIFYNKKTEKKKSEFVGMGVFLLMIMALIFLGHKFDGIYTITTSQQFVLMLAGGFFSYLLWPQYHHKI